MGQSIEEFVVSYWKKLQIPQDCASYKKQLERMSYKKYAAREILTYIRMHKSMHPIAAIEEYSQKMEEYAEMNAKSSYAFIVAHETAEDILYQIRKNKRNHYLY